jgi:magnesium-transporting ATPase (P-type)
MCTGDNLDTAKAIAINAGILPNNYLYSEDVKLLALRNNSLPKEDKIAL